MTMKTLISLLVLFVCTISALSAQKKNPPAPRPAPTALGAARPAVPLNLDEVLASIHYPYELMHKNIGSRVVYNVLVDTQGKVETFYTRNTFSTPFVDSVHNHIPDLKFNPASDAGGKPIRSWVVLPVVFRPQ